MAAGAGVCRKRASAGAAPRSAQPLLFAAGGSWRHWTDIADVKLAIHREQHVVIGRDALGRDLFAISLVPPSAVASDIDPLSCHIRDGGSCGVIVHWLPSVRDQHTRAAPRGPKRDAGRFGLASTPEKERTPRALEA